MAKITELLISIDLDEDILEQLQGVHANLHVHHTPASRLEELPQDLLTEMEILFTDHLLPGIELAPNLNWVHSTQDRASEAMFAALEKRPGLKISYCRGANAVQAAEHGLALLLALSKRLPDLINFQEKNEWLKKNKQKFQVKELFGATIGIFGYEATGRQLARLLNALGCTVLASKENAMQVKDTEYRFEGVGDPEGSFFTRLYPHQAAGSMFKECDAVVVTGPANQTTRHFIGEKLLSKLKPDAYLVDVSEGGIVELEALTTMLADNRIAGAALDAFPEYPLPSNNLLWTLPNVLITPHTAKQSNIGVKRCMEVFSTNLNRYMDGQQLFNLVEPIK